MASDQPNPYEAPQTDPSQEPFEMLSPAHRLKAETIVKDAGQFWLAILMCIVCTGIGALIIGPWYLVRLLQWNSLAREQPMLLDPHAARGTLAQRFQAAKVKLIIGICFGAVMFLGAVSLFGVSLLMDAQT